MTGFYSYRPEPEIVWITDLEQLKEIFAYNVYSYKKFVFARYEVVDKTHDKSLKKTASIKRAEEKKERHLKYKKHANCDVQIIENDLQSKLELSLSNVYGEHAVNEHLEKINKKVHESDFQWKPTNADMIIVDRNINMELKIVGVEADKFILTKSNKQMRLTVLTVADRFDHTTKITFFDNDIVDKMGDKKFIKVKNAEVNMRQFSVGDEKRPDGLKIPSWGSIEFIEGFSQIKNDAEIEQEIKEENIVRCEQINCSGRGFDEQFYCAKCNMELCSICIFEHRKATSISGLECDDEICRGSRKQNVGVC